VINDSVTWLAIGVTCVGSALARAIR